MCVCFCAVSPIQQLKCEEEREGKAPKAGKVNGEQGGPRQRVGREGHGRERGQGCRKADKEGRIGRRMGENRRGERKSGEGK